MKAQEILKNNLNNSITAKKKLLADEDNLNEFRDSYAYKKHLDALEMVTNGWREINERY